MTYRTTMLYLAITLVAAGARAQDAVDPVEALRSECEMLEVRSSPAVIDCSQALADAERADSPEAVEDILRRYHDTASPYDFERTVTDASRTGPTPFDDGG